MADDPVDRTVAERGDQRRIEPGDIDFYARIQADPEVARYIAHGRPRTREESENWLAAILFYLLFIAGLQFFIIAPALRGGGAVQALWQGAFFGLILPDVPVVGSARHQRGDLFMGILVGVPVGLAVGWITFGLAARFNLPGRSKLGLRLLRAGLSVPPYLAAFRPYRGRGRGNEAGRGARSKSPSNGS